MDDVNPLSNVTTGSSSAKKKKNVQKGVKKKEDENWLACSICMSTSDIAPFPRFAISWLASIMAGKMFVSGICPLCEVWLKRSIRLGEQAKKTQGTLLSMHSRGELSLSRVKELNSTTDHPPFIQLSTATLGQFDITNTQSEEEQLTLKTDELEPEPEVIETVEKIDVKQETDIFCDDFNIGIDNDNVLSSDSDSDKPILKIINEMQERAKKVKVSVRKKVKNEPKKRNTKKIQQIADEMITMGSKYQNILAAELIERLKKDPLKKPLDEKLNEYFEIKAFSIHEQKAEMLKKKATDVYLNSTFKCETCYQGFMMQEEFDSHVAGHPKSGQTCRICLRHCTGTVGLLGHIRSHFNRWIFQCKHCVYTTNSSENAKFHIEMHDGTKIECNICGKTFGKSKAYYAHRQLKHASENHACALCGRSFVNAHGLRCHINFKHKGEDKTIPEDGPQCVECDVRFRSEAALAAHLRFSARHKAKDFARPRRAPGPPCDLRRREQQEVVTCEQCGVSVPLRTYRHHFRKLHPTCTRTVFFERKERSLCTVCGQSVVSLRHHMMTHQEGAVRCPDCGKKFRTRPSMMNHRAVHREPRHVCPTCGKRFTQRANLNRHFTYAHNSVRDVKCDYCEKYFKSGPEKNNHVNYVHLKKPWPRKTAAKTAAKRPRRAESEHEFVDTFEDTI